MGEVRKELTMEEFNRAIDALPSGKVLDSNNIHLRPSSKGKQL